MDLQQVRELGFKARAYQHHVEMEAKYRIEENSFRIETIDGEMYPVGVVKQVYNILADYHKGEYDRIGELLDSYQK